MKKILLITILFVFSAVFSYAAGAKTPEKLGKLEKSEELKDLENTGVIIRMKDEPTDNGRTLNNLIEDYVDEYGLPDKATENIISRTGILYQAVHLEWEERDVIIEFHRKLTGKSLDTALEPYIEKYGLPDRTSENIISQSGIVYQEITLEWTEYEIFIKIHRKLDGEWRLREIKEETLYEAQIDSLAGVTTYMHSKKPKVVLFWNMIPLNLTKPSQPLPEGEMEVNEARWVSIEEAIKLLNYTREAALVRQNMNAFNPEEEP